MLVVEEKLDEIMVGGKLAWRDGGKPSVAKGGYYLGCQQLACRVGWHLLLKFTSEIATSIVRVSESEKTFKMHLATIRCNYAPAGALGMDYYVADFRLTPPPPRIFDFSFFSKLQVPWATP